MTEFGQERPSNYLQLFLANTTAEIDAQYDGRVVDGINRRPQRVQPELSVTVQLPHMAVASVAGFKQFLRVPVSAYQ